MLQIAIVEDSAEAAVQLEQALRRYSADYRTAMQIHRFSDPTVFLSRYEKQFDMVFMDILMPSMNGMDAAELLRQKDSKVMLIFVTTMQQYAIRAYEVSAADYILKPVVYTHFRLKFTGFLRQLQEENASGWIMIKVENGIVRLSPEEITYVEMQGHFCIYHTDHGDYSQYQTMKSAAHMLKPFGFAQCHSYLLVNLACVRQCSADEVHLSDRVLPISQTRSRAFRRELSDYKESKIYD